MTLLLYIASFVSGILAAPYFGYNLDSAMEAPTELFLFGIATSVLLTILFTHWYFASKDVKTTLDNGIIFGLFIVGFSFIIDMAIIIPTILASEAPTDPLAYYSHPLFWVTVFAIPITSGVTASYLSKRKPPKKTPKKTSPKKKPSKRKKM